MPLYDQLYITNLSHTGDALLLGAGAAGDLFAEEITPEGDSIQYHIAADGCHITQGADVVLPAALHTPHVPLAHPLDYTGGRWRGIRANEPVGDITQPMTIMQKITLLEQIPLDTTPMMLLGIIESKVLSTARITDAIEIVCRRVRLAYALAETAHDEHNQPYDYDSLPLYFVHEYDRDNLESPPLEQCLSGFGGVATMRPHDCLVITGLNRLVVCDLSDGTHPNRLLCYAIR